MNIVITGGSKGIGKAIAQKFILNDWNVFICARNLGQLEETKNELIRLNPKRAVYCISADLSKKKEVEFFAKEIFEKFETVDVLVNNTGTFQPGDISTEPDGILENMVETNLYSAYFLSRALIPSMKKNQKGHIINICSVASLQAYKNGGAYSISKYALLGFSKNLREELMPFQIKVTSVMPGATW
ncbi:MAG TPA: SDR family oxidoreductase, partial [Chitinophagaceae bacterium]|nr:SDR family oxidoreductase [Chitinophagaceae bacterium]